MKNVHTQQPPHQQQQSSGYRANLKHVPNLSPCVSQNKSIDGDNELSQA